MGHVFVSYSRTKGKAVAKACVDALEGSGINLWFDQYDIIEGANWNEEESNALKSMSAMLVITTEDSYRSGSIHFEAKFAQKSNVPVIALCVDDCVLPEFLSAIPLVHSQQDAWIEELIRLLPESTISQKEVDKTHSKSAKGYIFISYCLEDSAFVEKLRNFLAEKGYAYWDYQETSREYDLPFHLEIEIAIRKASAVISVVSPDWKISQWATREFLFSEQIGKTNFVCIVRDVGPTLLYADKTFIEFFNNDAYGFSTLDKALRREGLID